jgi:hypothetical protein
MHIKYIRYDRHVETKKLTKGGGGHWDALKQDHMDFWHKSYLLEVLECKKIQKCIWPCEKLISSQKFRDISRNFAKFRNISRTLAKFRDGKHFVDHPSFRSVNGEEQQTRSFFDFIYFYTDFTLLSSKQNVCYLDVLFNPKIFQASIRRLTVFILLVWITLVFST